jgi:hypothetical protein
MKMTNTIKDVALVIPVVPFTEVPEKPLAPIARYATVREIEFAPDGDRLRMYFSKWSNEVDLNPYGGIQGLIDAIFSTSQPYRFQHETESVPDSPYLSGLSLRNGSLRYIVYVLSAKQWQVCRIGRPVTLGKKAADSGVYYNARRSWAPGPGGTDNGTSFEADENQGRDGCKVLYFLANGTAALAQSQPPNEYEHRINLHVDLIQDAQHRIPIIIDPDIRFPGGSDD